MIISQEKNAPTPIEAADQAAPETASVTAGGFGSLKKALFARVAGGNNSQLRRNMGAGSIAAVVGSFLSLLSYPLYLHYLGYHRFGLWLVLSVVVSVAQLGNLGIPWAMMKLIAEESSRGDWEGVRSYITMGCGIILTIGMIFILAVSFARPLILRWFKLSGPDAGTVSSMLVYVAVLSLLVILFETFNTSIGGLGRMDLSSLNENIAQTLVILFSVALLYMGLGLWAMLLGALAAYALAQTVSFIQLQRRMPIRIIGRSRLDPHRMRRLLGTGGWILASGTFAGFLLPFTRLMLSRFAGLEAVAVNDMCYSGSMRVKNVFDAAFRPMVPELSGAGTQGGLKLSQRVRSLNVKALKLVLCLALPIFMVLFVANRPLLHIWLRRSFNPLLPGTFRIALIGAFVSLLGSSAYYMLIGLGRARDSAYAAAIQFIANAAVLVTCSLHGRHLTVTQAAGAFGISAAATTLFLETRLLVFAGKRALI